MHNLNQYSYSRERRRFGRQYEFSDINQYMFNIQPSIKRRLNYILKTPVERSTQLGSQFAVSEVETENPDFIEHGMFHFEGGWPKEVNLNDEESTMRYRKKIEREDEWGPQVVRLIEQSMIVCDQNSAVNIYDDFFVDLPPDLGAGIRKTFESRSCNIFHDPIQPSRRAHFIDWCPGEPNYFLVQHTDTLERYRDMEDGLEFEYDVPIPSDTRSSIRSSNFPVEVPIVPRTSGNAFFVWDLENPLKPKIFLDGREVVKKAVYCPKDDNYIAGGYQSGTVCLWDAKNGGMPIDVTPLESSHREPLSAICWVHNKTNSEFYTGSSDGSLKYWDYRDLSKPSQEVLLDPSGTDEQRRDRAHGVACLEFEYTIPVRFIAGSEHGHVFIGNRKGSMPTEMLPNNYKLFEGPVRTIERNPFFVKNFVICGDWCAKIWTEECKGYPLTFIFKKKNELLCGSWSTSRCSLFVTGDNKGELDFWDLLLNQREPIFTMKFSSPITHATFRPDGEFLAIALENGDVLLLELDEAMRQSRPAEKPLIAALFEREQLRCKLLEGRVEEIKLKHDLAEKVLEEAEVADTEVQEVLDPNDPEQFLQIVERDLELKEVIQVFKEITVNLDKRRQERNYRMERTDFEERMDMQAQLQVENDQEVEVEPSKTKSKVHKELKLQDTKEKGSKKKK